MVFGFDDLIEGATISEILFFIASSIFGPDALISVEGSIISFFSNLLGKEGIIALSEIINDEASLTSEIIVKEFEQEGIAIWEEEELEFIKGSTTKLGFIQRVSVIAKNLASNGVNFVTGEGTLLLKKIMKPAIEILKKGIKVSLDPKILAPSLIAAVGGTALYKKFQNTSRVVEDEIEGKTKYLIRNNLLPDV